MYTSNAKPPQSALNINASVTVLLVVLVPNTSKKPANMVAPMATTAVTAVVAGAVKLFVWSLSMPVI